MLKKEDITMTDKSGKITNEKDYDFGFIPSGYIAKDNSGHEGTGYSPETAQKALEQAQSHDVPRSEHKIIGDVIIDCPKK